MTEKALVPVEEVLPAVLPDPDLLEIIMFPEDMDQLPNTPTPYFALAQEGLYLHKKVTIGRCLLPQEKMPEHLNSIGKIYEDGYFSWGLGKKIPANIMSLALSFFRRVYETMKAEAEVLILFNEESREFMLFVPYQVVSHGSVDSIYDPADLPADYTVIGTIHSHCNFSAFHSSTDEGDARNFNGVHITIGHVDSNRPSFDAMVMINKLKFSYKFTESVAEIDELDLVDAPEEWLKFCYEKPDEILAMDFKSLTDAEVAAFARRTRPITVIQQGKGTSDWSEDSFFGAYGNWGRGTYLAKNRWNPDFQESLPVEFFIDQSLGGPTELTTEGFEKVMTRRLEKMFDLCKKYGVYLNYNLRWVEESDENVHDAQSN